MNRQLAAAIGLLCLAVHGAWAGFSDWQYRRLVTFSAATATNDYQVRVDLTTTNFNYAHCDVAGSDLRFEDASTSASLSYWIQVWSNTATSTIWVKVPTTGTTNFWFYYGKSGVPAASSGTNTFIFFDDFDDGVIDTARWSKGGSMTESGGYATGAASEKDYLFGKTRIPVDTLTRVRMRNRAAPNAGCARPGVLVSAGNPYSVVGFGWQDYSNGSRYTDTFDSSVTQVQDGTYNTGWYDLETAWQAGSVKFYVNGSLLITHTTQVPAGTRVLYEQVDGNADYDLVYARRFVSSEPVSTVGSEQVNFIPGAPTVANAGVTNVWASSAWLNGVLVYTGTAQTAWGVLWGTNNPGQTRNGWLGGGSMDLGSAAGESLTNSTQAAGLAEDQTYYFTYWATNASGTNVASPMTFTTKGAPVVDNASGATGIGRGTATLNGYLSVTGGLPVEVYVYWGPDTNSWAHTNYLGFCGVGAFSVPVSNLWYGVRYYYRCYAANSYSNCWADANTNFLTLPPLGGGLPVTNGLSFWLAADDAGTITTNSSGNVTRWNDKSSGGHNVTASAGKEPGYVSNQVNGKPAVRFNNGPSLGATWSITGDQTFFVIAKATEYQSMLRWQNNGGSAYVVYDWGANHWLINYANGGSTTGIDAGLGVNNTWKVCSVLMDIGTVNGTVTYTNGVAVSTTTWNNGYTSDSTFCIGSYNNSSEYMNGDIAEVLVYGRALDADERGQVGGYLANKYGLATMYPPFTVGTLGVTNTGASALTPGSATFNGLVQATGSVFDVWAYWGPADGTNNPSVWVGSNLVATVTNNAANSVSTSVSGLSAGTVYFTFRIVNAATNFWASPSGSAVVLATSDTPTISTQPESGVNTNVATLNGFLTSTGASATAVSVYWGPGGDQIVGGAWAYTNDFGACAFLPPAGVAYATNVTGLIPGQLYTYRYYAVNATTGFWGDARSFTTWIAPRVDNGSGATAVSATNATLRGSVLGGNPSPQAWVYWGTADGGANRGGWDRPAIAAGVQAGAFAANVYGLLANTQYWYRCYVSNACGEGWATASTNFATGAPALTIGNASVNEGALGAFTTAVLTVTLSATSAAPVSVSYATSNGANAVAGTDYYATNGTLTLPAGVASAPVQVTVIGNDLFEASKTVAVNLTSPVNATLGNTQGVVTIVNDDWNLFVRGDGLGSDTNSGATWNRAFATLQKALDTVPYYTPVTVNVQASTGSQSYAPCTRSLYANPSTYRPFGASFIGGWQNVDVAPAQSGLSLVRDPATNKPGFQLLGPYNYHSEPKTIVFDRFVFTNVTDGIQFVVPSGSDNSDVLLTVSNTSVYAKSNGIYISYPKAYQSSYGKVRLTANNVCVHAGLGGAGCGVYVMGQWPSGSSIGAVGTDPATGASCVSTVTSDGGVGVYFSTPYGAETCQAAFSNLVIHGCSTNGLYLDTIGYVVRASFNHCTVVDNAGDGLQMRSVTAGSWAAASNSIFANNGGHGISVAGTNGPPAFVCTEGYNVFFNDDIFTNGAAQSLAASSSGADPLFYGQGAKPSPWYLLRSAVSPAYHRASDGLNRGAYQNDRIAGGTAVFFR
jgi:hypothetical protein